MSDSLFDDESTLFLVLKNSENQYSIWPEILSVPSGWKTALGPKSRQACMDWLGANWTDLIPLTTAKERIG